MKFLFIVNDLEIREAYIKAEDIMNALLERNIWALSISSPKQNSIEAGDKGIVYLAGKRNRCFAADFEIASRPKKQPKRDEDPEWLAIFPIKFSLQNCRVWENPLSMKDVIEELRFIKDKKTYGLHLRQSTRVLDDEDFDAILNFREK